MFVTNDELQIESEQVQWVPPGEAIGCFPYFVFQSHSQAQGRKNLGGLKNISVLPEKKEDYIARKKLDRMEEDVAMWS